MLNKILFFFDFHGMEYSLREENHTKFHTVTGGIISILSLLSIATITFLFGSDILVYKNPIVNTGETMISSDDTMRNLENIPLIYNFIDSITYEQILNISDYFDLEVLEINVDSKGVFKNEDPILKQFVKCNTSKWITEHKNSFEYLANTNGYYCINFNNTYVKNEIDEPNSISQTIKLKKCKKETDSKCKNFDDENKKIGVIIYTLGHMIDPDNYLNPLTIKSTSTFFFLDSKIHYGMKLTLLNNNILTDVGKVLFENNDLKYVS